MVMYRRYVVTGFCTLASAPLIAPVIVPILFQVFFQISTVLNIFLNVQMYCTAVGLTIPIIFKQYWSNYQGNYWGRGQSAKPYNEIPSIHYRALHIHFHANWVKTSQICCIVAFYIKWVTASWTHRSTNIICHITKYYKCRHFILMLQEDPGEKVHCNAVWPDLTVTSNWLGSTLD